MAQKQQISQQWVSEKEAEHQKMILKERNLSIQQLKAEL
jgi:hypothetical protein